MTDQPSEPTTRWVDCPGCDGEVGVPAGWTEETVTCPQCGAVVAAKEEPVVQWRKKATTDDGEVAPTPSAPKPKAKDGTDDTAVAAPEDIDKERFPAAVKGVEPLDLEQVDNRTGKFKLALKSISISEMSLAAGITGLIFHGIGTFMFESNLWFLWKFLWPLASVLESVTYLFSPPASSVAGEVLLGPSRLLPSMCVLGGLFLNMVGMSAYLKARGRSSKRLWFLLFGGLIAFSGIIYVTGISKKEEARLGEEEEASVFYNKGHQAQVKGNTSQAIYNYDQVIAIAPAHAYAYYNRGLAHQQIGDIAKAKADFAKAKELGYEPADE